MANTAGTPGGVGSPQGGQQGWDDAENVQPIPPSREGTTSAGGFDMATKTDAEKRAEAEAKSKDKSGETDSERLGKVDLTQPHSTDPTDPGSQENFGLPDGVSTKASRGEVEGQDASRSAPRVSRTRRSRSNSAPTPTRTRTSRRASPCPQVHSGSSGSAGTLRNSTLRERTPAEPSSRSPSRGTRSLPGR